MKIKISNKAYLWFCLTCVGLIGARILLWRFLQPREVTALYWVILVLVALILCVKGEVELL